MGGGGDKGGGFRTGIISPGKISRGDLRHPWQSQIYNSLMHTLTRKPMLRSAQRCKRPRKSQQCGVLEVQAKKFFLISTVSQCSGLPITGLLCTLLVEASPH